MEVGRRGKWTRIGRWKSRRDGKRDERRGGRRWRKHRGGRGVQEKSLRVGFGMWQG